MTSSNTSIRTSAIRGGAWTFGAQGLLFILQIVSISVLARVLKPGDFGLIGMLSAVIAVLGMFREMGLTTAIVQRPTVEPEELSRIFRLTLIFGIILVGITSIAGLGAAWLVDEPRLIAIAPWFGLCFLLSSIETIPLALLSRSLRFRSLAIRSVIARLFSFTAALCAALAGLGYKALVIQAVVAATMSLVMSWSAARWWPTAKPSSWHAVRPYIGFGAAYTGSNMATYFTQNLDSLLIGKFWGMEALGLYTRSRALMLSPIQQIMGPISSVLIPVFSRLKDDPQRLSRWIDRLSLIMIFGAGPAAALMMAGADDFILILLGPDWIGAAPIFRWLAIFVITAPMGSLLHMTLVTSGNTRLLLNWTWVGATVTCLSMVIAVPWGPTTVAASYALSGLFVRSFIAIHYSSKTGLLDRKVMSKRLLYGIAHAAAWFAILYFAEDRIPFKSSSPWLHLSILIAAWGILLSLVITLSPFGRSIYHELKNILPELSGSSRLPKHTTSPKPL